MDWHTLQVVEDHTFTNDSALRALLRLEFRHHFSDVEQERAADQFDAVLDKIDIEMYDEALEELAPLEEIALPFSFGSFNYTYIVNVILKNNIVKTHQNTPQAV